VDAEQVLRNAGRRSPGLVTLALLLSPAVRIEPELIRAVRLELIPKLSASAEGNLWFSTLVSARGLDGIVLHPDVASVLRARARAILLPSPAQAAPDDFPGPGDLRRARDLIDRLHAGSPPVLRLEETVNWLAVSELEPAASIDGELQLAVEALRRGRAGVARWAARALPRMPAAARGTTAAWLLAQSAGRRLVSYEGRRRPPDIARIDDLASLLPPRDDVPLGVSRRYGEPIVLGDVDRDGVSVPVLDTDPRVIAVSVAGQENERIVFVPKGGQVQVDVGLDAALLRTPRGETYRIEPVPTDDYLSSLRRSCVVVQVGHEERIGIAVAPDQVLTAGPEPKGEPVMISRYGPRIAGEWLAGGRGLAVLTIPHLPDGVQPDRPRTISLPSAGARWIGLTNTLGGILDDAWPSITGVITETNPDTGQLIASVDDPGDVAVPGGPMVVNGLLAGMITSVRSEFIGGGGRVEAAAIADLLNSVAIPDPLPALASAVQGILLELHLRFEGFGRAGNSLDTDALMADAGLTVGQLRAVRGAAEWVIQTGTDERTMPRWLPPSSSGPFSAAVLAALDEASSALSQVGQPDRRLTLAREYALTTAARQALAEVGVSIDHAEPDGVSAVLDGDLLSGQGFRRLVAILADELPGFDYWDPWSPAPEPGAERPQVLLDVVSDLCSANSSVPERARTTLISADRHIIPQWWTGRDGTVRAGVPEIGADQSFPDFAEAYLGWCLTILSRVAASAGSSAYDMGFSILRKEAVTLPTDRFGLEMRPAQPDTHIRLFGKFSSLVSFSAWVFLEYMDQVRLAAQLPPRYQVPPPRSSA